MENKIPDGLSDLISATPQAQQPEEVERQYTVDIFSQGNMVSSIKVQAISTTDAMMKANGLIELKVKTH